MCYLLRQVHLNCPKVNLPDDTGVHTIESLIRCSSPQPCQGRGFGTLTKTYGNQAYCQSCLGSVVAARATLPGDGDGDGGSGKPTYVFRLNDNEDELVGNLVRYVDHLLALGLLALHESLDARRVHARRGHLYPLPRLQATLLWETTCPRCRVPVQCRCRPGRNEAGWNVARAARTAYAKRALARFEAHTARAARAAHAVAVRNEVLDGLEAAGPLLTTRPGPGPGPGPGGVPGPIPVSYDVAPFKEELTGERFSWIAHDMLDSYRLPPPTGDSDGDGSSLDADDVETMEMCTRFDLVELLSSIISHDTGVPFEVVRAIGSRLLPIVMLTRQQVTTRTIPPLTTPYDELQIPGDDGGDGSSSADNGVDSSMMAMNIDDDDTSDDDNNNNNNNANDSIRTIRLPVATLLQDGVFQSALVELIRLEAAALGAMYRNPASVSPRFHVPGDPARDLGPRFRGGFEITMRAIHDDLMRENSAMVRWETNRQMYWRVLLRDVHGGVTMLTPEQITSSSSSSSSSASSSAGRGETTAAASCCLMHLTSFFETAEMEEPRLHVNGGELEPQPLHRHGAIRLRNCAPSERPHAFCMVGLAEWSFIRRQNPNDGRLWVEEMRQRKCPQCMRVLRRTSS